MTSASQISRQQRPGTLARYAGVGLFFSTCVQILAGRVLIQACIVVMVQAWKTPSLLVYAAVRRIGYGGHSIPPSSILPSLDTNTVPVDVFTWKYNRPHQPLLTHIRPPPPRSLPSRLPHPREVVAMDAEFVATSTQEVGVSAL